MANKSKALSADMHNELDRGFYNMSYMMILLNNRLAEWAKEHKLNTAKTYLMFVTQIESTNLTDVYVNLVYGGEGIEEQVIPAGYVGQRLSSAEKLFTSSLPFYASKDLKRTPPYEIMRSGRLKELDDSSGIVHEVCMAFHNYMEDTCSISAGINAGLASANGNAMFFIKDNANNVTKMEFYLKDLTVFIKNIVRENRKVRRDKLNAFLSGRGVTTCQS